MISTKDRKKHKKVIQSSGADIVFSNEDEHLNKTKGGTLNKKLRKPRFHQRPKNESLYQAKKERNSKLDFKNSSTTASNEVAKGKRSGLKIVPSSRNLVV